MKTQAKPKKQPALQWPPGDEPFSFLDGMDPIAEIVDVIRQTHRVEPLPGVKSKYRGLPLQGRFNDGSVPPETYEGRYGEDMFYHWVNLAFQLGVEQGRRLASEDTNLFSAVLRNPWVLDSFERRFELYGTTHKPMLTTRTPQNQAQFRLDPRTVTVDPKTGAAFLTLNKQQAQLLIQVLTEDVVDAPEPGCTDPGAHWSGHCGCK